MILPFIIAGLVSGAVYGLAGVGLVLTYKTSGVFNFAQGAVATVGAYVFYTLYVLHGVSWPIAALIAVLGVGFVLGVAFEHLARAIAGKSLALVVTSTVGVLLIVQAGVLLIFGTEQTRRVPDFLPSGDFVISGTHVQYSDLVTFLFATLATALLYVLFRFTRIGTSMRAVVDSPDLLRLSGTSAVSVRRYAWIIGITFACASGVLFSTSLPLDPSILTLLVVQALGAAAIGAFRNLPMTFVGGLIIGVLSALATKYVPTGFWAGIPQALPFLVLFIALLVFPRRYLRQAGVARPESRVVRSAPPFIQMAAATILLVFLVFVPSFAGIHITEWTVALAYVILFLSLGLLVRTSGQVSLCHISFMAIGATTFGHLAGLGLPWFFALLGAMAIAIPIGALLAIPAIRLTPVYLALSTLGFGILLEFMFYTQSFMFGGSGGAVSEPRPSSIAGDTGFYYLVLGIAVFSALAVLLITRTRLGRLLRGMAESPTVVATNGTATTVTWVLVFCISASMAALAGALGGMAQGSATAASYQPLTSLSLLAVIMIVVGGTPWYAVIAAFVFILPPAYISGSTVTYWLQMIFGVSAVLISVLPASKLGAPPVVGRVYDALSAGWSASRWSRWARNRRLGLQGDHPAPALVKPEASVEQRSLAVENLSVRFGGLVAVDGVTLSAPTGRITGLIGPNGAGKTTTFNVCSGLLKPTNGQVELDSRPVTRRGPAFRARLGLGRTFQKSQLFDSLSVRENVAIGMEAGLAGTNPIRQVFGRRHDGHRVRRACEEAMEICGLNDLGGREVGTLSTGHRRLVELARCLTGEYRILLLDEPSSGLDSAETARFGAILSQVVAERGVGILLVEHDMSLVMDICEHIYVLDFGKQIFEGSPAEISGSPVVQAAYLGDEAIEASQGVTEPPTGQRLER
jgi:ABC-type branched-subunit amino acid transport system ATPase component/branched-subunit amino acid ABC-type transport system permease component